MYKFDSLSLNAFLKRKEKRIGPLPECQPALTPEQSPGVLVIRSAILQNGKAELSHRILFSRNLAWRVQDLAKSLPGYELVAAYRTHDLAQAKRVHRALSSQFRGKRILPDWFNLGEQELSFLREYQSKVKQAPIGALKGMTKELVWRALCLVSSRLGRMFSLDDLLEQTCQTGLDMATVQGQVQMLEDEGKLKKFGSHIRLKTA